MINYADYDYEKENYKSCPVCGRIIDYHIVGFTHYWKENVWVCRDHTIKERELGLRRPLTKKEKKWVEYNTNPNPEIYK